MSSYRVKETVDGIFEYIEADYYIVDEFNNLQFYNSDCSAARETRRLWVSVGIVGESEDRNE